MSNAEIAQRYARGSVALFIGNLLNAAITAVAILVIVRLLPPDIYGTYTLVILFPSVLLNFLGFGVGSGITRFAAYHLARNEPNIAKRMTMNGLTFLLAFGALLSVVCYAGAGLFSSFILHRPELVGEVQFASVLLMGQTLFISAQAGLLGWSLMGRMSVTSVVQSSMRVVLSVGLVVAGLGVVGAVGGYAASLALGGVLAIVLLWWRISTSKSLPDSSPATGEQPAMPDGTRPGFLSDIRTMLVYGIPLFIGQLGMNLSSQYVVALLASFATDTLVGYYQSAVNITIAISLSSSAISQTLFPAFASLHGASGQIERAFKYATKYMSFFLTPIIFLLMASAPRIVGLLYQSSYAPASPYLVLLAFSNIALLFGSGVLPSFFSGVGRPRLFMAYSLASAATELVLGPLLGIYSGLGISGLIYSILASNLVGATVGLWMASRYLKSTIDVKSAISILASSAVSYLLVYIFQANSGGLGNVSALVLQVVIFAIVYLTVAPIAGAINDDDIERLGVASRGLGKFHGVITLPLRYESFILKLVHRT